MLISNKDIKDWNGLEKFVASFFEEMDYAVELKKKLELVRGTKEIDVYAVDNNSSTKLVYLIECKFWETEVKQETVHSFRTVVQDSGANAGYIVSKVGFQAGAYKAAEFSNVYLVTVEELQHRFGNEWFYKMKQKLFNELQEVIQNYNLYFDYQNSITIMNNVKFYNEEMGEELSYYFKQYSNYVSLNISVYPRDYKGPEPVQCAINPFDPYWDAKGFYTFPTVRDYFNTMIACTKKLNGDFKSFVLESKNKFEELDADEQKKYMDEAMYRLIEESPIRVLKRVIDESVYKELVNKLL